MARLTLPEVKERFAAYRAAHPEWGPLHIVLSDGNVDDDSVRWCLAEARRQEDAEAVALCELLLRLTRTQRRKLPVMLEGN